MSKHTPGPWRVLGSSAANGTSNEIRAGGKLIARVFLNGNAFEREANASVMAAAPELLEALKAMVECSHTMDVHTCANASQLALAAIAKATGEHHDN